MRGLRFGIAILVVGLLVDSGQRIEHPSPQGPIDTGRIGQIEHWVTLTPQCNPLVLAGQKAGAPGGGYKWPGPPCDQSQVAVMTTNEGRLSFREPRP